MFGNTGDRPLHALQQNQAIQAEKTGLKTQIFINVLSFKTNRLHWSSLSVSIQQERASGMIKFLTGSCLSGLEIVLKEP